MGKSVYIVFLFAAVVGMMSCHKGGDGEMEAVNREPVMLKINVSLSDLPQTKAGEELSASDHERMQSLRVIVVNSTNDIEGNEFIDLTTTPAERHTVSFRRVKSNDAKMIYLIANEKTRKKTTIAGVVEERPLVDYDFNTLVPGRKKFPTDEIFALRMNLKYNYDELSPDQLTGSLPMSEWHRVRIPSIAEYQEQGSDEDGLFLLDDADRALLPPIAGEDNEIYGYRKTLWITRAAVKFTCRIKNETGLPLTVKGIGLDKMATCEYFMPRVTERNGHEITAFAVPMELTDNSSYYQFQLQRELPQVMTDGQEYTWEPFYLLEGKYADKQNEDKTLNYKVNLTVDNTRGEVTLSDYLPDLSQLPRNTHVVLDITVKGPEIVCEVHVHPYISVPLEPDFGL